MPISYISQLDSQAMKINDLTNIQFLHHKLAINIYEHILGCLKRSFISG